MAEGDVLRINAEGDQEFAQPAVGPMEVGTRTLTNAEILALLDTVEVVAGQPGKLLWPISGCAINHGAGAGYSMTQAQKLIVAIGPGLFPIMEIVGSQQVITEQDRFAVFTPSAAITDTPPTGEPITVGLDMENPNGPDGGTLDIIVVYRVIDMA